MNLRGNDMDTKNQDKYRGMMLDGRYELVELIGSGGMAVVYKAMCHRLNRYVAVKIMRPELAKNEKFRRRFQTESQAIAKLSHPNIVGVYDVSRTDHVEYIVMELVDGITLKQYLQDHGPLDAVQAVDFSLQIARRLPTRMGKALFTVISSRRTFLSSMTASSRSRTSASPTFSPKCRTWRTKPSARCIISRRSRPGAFQWTDGAISIRLASSCTKCSPESCRLMATMTGR